MTHLLRLHDRPVEHDYTRPMWGHALHMIKIYEKRLPRSWRDWLLRRPPEYLTVLTCMGHGSVRAMDTILVKMKSGRVARFEVRDIEYCYNPRDMFDIKMAVFLDYANPTTLR